MKIEMVIYRVFYQSIQLNYIKHENYKESRLDKINFIEGRFSFAVFYSLNKYEYNCTVYHDILLTNPFPLNIPFLFDDKNSPIFKNNYHVSLIVGDKTRFLFKIFLNCRLSSL